ncbi:MAG: chloroperoxidase [Pseudomonadota bacterium]
MSKIMKMTTALGAVLLASSVIALPASADVEPKTEEERVQGAGYIGQLSRRAIASGAMARLESSGLSVEVEDTRDRVFFWHSVALDTVAIDHTPDAATDEAPLENGGPTRTSRALAMVQIAVFDAINALDPTFTPFNELSVRSGATSEDAAISQAAYSTLLALYPSQASRLREIFSEDQARIRDETPTSARAEISRGNALGRNASRAILRDRRNDGSEIGDPSFGEGGEVADGTTTFFNTPVNGGTSNIGEWQPDPNTPEFAGEFNLSLGAFWGAVDPFFLESGDQFRIPEPPLPDSDEYTTAYNEVAGLGGSPDNVATPSTGNDETRFIGNYWGYDGVPLIGVPPRVYNQIAAQLIEDELEDDSAVGTARLLAQVNIALADVAIAAWDSKYFYNYWRPVTGIRVDDGNPDTSQDPSWDPVGTSVINTAVAIRPTPPFPAYPSGHAAFGAALFEIMRDNFGNRTPFTFISDEFNGEGEDPFLAGAPRPLVPVRFRRLRQAQRENGDSRIFNGVHWQFDNSTGQTQGEQVARFLLDEVSAFQPLDDE